MTDCLAKVRSNQMADSPFIHSNYTLRLCQLRELTQAEIIAMSQTLAQMEPWLTLNYSAKTLANYLGCQDPSLHQYGITSPTQQVAGVICIRYPWLRGPYIELFAVSHSQQGQGIGRDIINWLVTELRQNTNLHNLWALVSEFNHEAQHFYQKMGFVEMAQLDDLVVTGYNEILLRKVLTSSS